MSDNDAPPPPGMSPELSAELREMGRRLGQQFSEAMPLIWKLYDQASDLIPDPVTRLFAFALCSKRLQHSGTQAGVPAAQYRELVERVLRDLYNETVAD
jgi:hypothetical protein